MFDSRRLCPDLPFFSLLFLLYESAPIQHTISNGDSLFRQLQISSLEFDPKATTCECRLCAITTHHNFQQDLTHQSLLTLRNLQADWHVLLWPNFWSVVLGLCFFSRHKPRQEQQPQVSRKCRRRTKRDQIYQTKARATFQKFDHPDLGSHPLA